MQENKRNGQSKGQNYRRDKISKGHKYIIRGGRREKSSLTIQENLWCVCQSLYLQCKMVDENGKSV